MVVNDPVGDLLISLKNASMAGHDICTVYASHFRGRLLDVLATNGFIKTYKVINPEYMKEKVKNRLKKMVKFPHFEVVLAKYKGIAVLQDVKRFSKPSARRYSNVLDLKKMATRFADMYLISTVRGVLTAQQAVEAGVGGELICRIKSR